MLECNLSFFLSQFPHTSHYYRNMTPNPPSALELESDDLLVERSRAGNCEAFGALVVRYQSPICALAYSATGSLPQSEDLAQETFLFAWKDLSKLRDPSRFRGWLHGIARNVINNSLRRQAREPSHRAESFGQPSGICPFRSSASRPGHQPRGSPDSLAHLGTNP